MQLIECLATNDSYGLLEIENSTSVALAMEGASIRSLSKTLQKKDIIKSISFFIHRFNDNFNAKGKLTDEQIGLMAMDLFDMFGYETLEDVMLMFKYARQGKIGDGRDFKLDSQTVFHKWMPEYLELKSIERENQHSKSKGELNSITNFKWKKEDLDNFKVDKTEKLLTKLGERTKEKFNVEGEPRKVILKDRSKYLNEMFYQVRKMTDEQLTQYMIKVDIKNTNDSTTIPFDKDIFELVEQELDRRKV